MEELMKTTWSEEELVRELLDDESPLIFMLPQAQEEITDDSNSKYHSSNDTLLLHQPMSDPGPTIEEEEEEEEEGYVNESGLYVTSTDHHHNYFNHSQPRSSSMLERGVCKGESKYTLQIKSCGNVMADDGYKWRKYGQKSIKNSSNPRSYYKCTNPRCSAKKQVQRSTDDPDTLIITYEGLHLHFTYPFFLLGQADHPESSPKKPKKSIPQVQDYEHDQQIQEEEEEEERPQNVETGPPQATVLAQEEVGSQGLLEDIVPLVIRNPHVNTSSSHSSSGSTCPPSPPTSPPSFPWSPYDYSPLSFDIGVL